MTEASAGRQYCTYFDSNYLPAGLALYESLRRHGQPFQLHVLCLDERAHEFLSDASLEGIHPVRLSDLEQADPALLAVRSSRTRIEYYFTCTAALVLYLLDRIQTEDITYLDADLFFYRDPAPIFAEIGAGSVGIVGHRFPPDQQHREVYGVYNVGFLFFRNDPEGRRCVQWWRDRCLEWCYDRIEDGKFADQKYLDHWPALFRGVVVLTHPGVGLAPWNQSRYALAVRQGQAYVDGAPLIFYHFHGLRLVLGIFAKHGLANYGGQMSAALMSIYRPYIRELRKQRRRVRGAAGMDIRNGTQAGILHAVKSVTREHVIVQVGPVAVETRFASALKPLSWLYRMVGQPGKRRSH